MDIIDHQVTWFNDGKTFYIDFKVVNDKLRNYLKIASVSNSFNNFSVYLLLIHSCRNNIS